MPLLNKGLEIEKKQTEYHPLVAIMMNNLAMGFYRVNEYDKALKLSQRALGALIFSILNSPFFYFNKRISLKIKKS